MRSKRRSLLYAVFLVFVFLIGGVFADRAEAVTPQIAAGYFHSLALKSDGTLWAWGFNGYGQLGICTKNNKTSPVQIQCDLVPDLIIQSITTNPVNPGAGQNVTVTVTVKNQGTLTSGQFIIDFYKDLPTGVTPNPPGDSEDFWCTVASLAAGATDSSCTKSVTYSNTNTYNMWTYVDTAKNVSESNEINNVYGPQAITVCNLNTYYYDADIDGYGDPNTAIQACYQPVGYVTSSLDCDDTYSTINPFAIEICDNKDNNCDGQVDEGIASTPTTCGVGACASTGVQQCTNGKMVDTCAPGNPQTEGPVSDPTCSDGPDNDCNGLTDASDPNCTPPTSDLAVTSVSNPPASRKRGRSFNVTAKIKNKGVGAAGKEFTIGYYLSKNRYKRINKEADIMLTDNIIMSSLVAGEHSTKRKISVNIGNDTPTGRYYVKVCTDNRNDIAETNENNNCRASMNKMRVKK